MPLREISHAYRLLGAGGILGKIVLSVEGHREAQDSAAQDSTWPRSGALGDP